VNCFLSLQEKISLWNKSSDFKPESSQAGFQSEAVPGHENYIFNSQFLQGQKNGKEPFQFLFD